MKRLFNLLLVGKRPLAFDEPARCHVIVFEILNDFTYLLNKEIITHHIGEMLPKINGFAVVLLPEYGK